MAGADGAVTTGLLTAVRYVKDNRLLPEGFDKTSAGSDIAVHGEAAQDPDFAAPRDRIRYSVPVSGADGPYRVQAELWYQPIAYRWARNLLQREAGEITRFVSYYESMSRSSAALLARDSAQVAP